MFVYAMLLCDMQRFVNPQLNSTSLDGYPGSTATWHRTYRAADTRGYAAEAVQPTLCSMPTRCSGGRAVEAMSEAISYGTTLIKSGILLYLPLYTVTTPLHRNYPTPP